MKKIHRIQIQIQIRVSIRINPPPEDDHLASSTPPPLLLSKRGKEGWKGRKKERKEERKGKKRGRDEWKGPRLALLQDTRRAFPVSLTLPPPPARLLATWWGVATAYRNALLASPHAYAATYVQYVHAHARSPVEGDRFLRV